VKPLILIVDDEPDVGLYLTAVLEDAGYRTATATTVAEALAAVKAEAPSLVCLDVMMPKESGLSFYLALRAKPKWRRIPVIVVSGVAPSGEFDFRQYVDDPAISPPDGYVEKPIRIDDFLRSVRKFVAVKGSPRTDGRAHA
jgi:CheY-like chemotaxis protein